MILYLVSKQIAISEFRKIGPTFLNSKAVLEKLTAPNDVFVFADLAEAKSFATTVGCAVNESVSFAIGMVDEFPIFEVDLSVQALIIVRDRTLSAVEKSFNGNVYVNASDPYQYLNEEKIFKESLGFNANDLKIKAVHSVSDHNYAIQYPCIKLPFFRSLNPMSKNSGVYHCNLRTGRCEGSEVIDMTFGEAIANAAENTDLSRFMGTLKAMYNLILGDHYGLSQERKEAKGLLDFLILPLLARKLISDYEKAEVSLVNAVAWIIAVPIELLRVGAAFCLTALLSPIIAATNLIVNFCQCLSQEKVDQETINYSPN